MAFGLLVSGVTVWPVEMELREMVAFFWGDVEPTNGLHQFLAQVIEGVSAMKEQYPFLLYGYDWLAYAHVMLAILFAGAIRNPVRNVWILECGLIMCIGVPVLAFICVPLRGLPSYWFWIDSAFAPAAGIPLWIALRDVKRAERSRYTFSKW